MKRYYAPKAQVINFNKDYVAATTYPSPSSTDTGGSSAVEDGDSGAIIPN